MIANWIRQVLEKNVMFLFPGGRLCSFSPCIEQVQRACAKLTDLGFMDITTMEVLLRDFSMYTVHVNVEDSWEEYPSNMPGTRTENPRGEPDVGMYEVVGGGATMELDGDEDSDEETNKKDRKRSRQQKWDKKRKAQNSNGNNAANMLTCRFKSAVPRGSAHGHTGFLTFATLLPSLERLQAQVQERTDVRACDANRSQGKAAADTDNSVKTENPAADSTITNEPKSEGVHSDGAEKQPDSTCNPSAEDCQPTVTTEHQQQS